MTTCPLKQGGLAAQQADVVVQTIAGNLGIPAREVRAPPVLSARMLAGEPGMFLRREFDWSGQPARSTGVRSSDEHAAKGGRVLGRYLFPSVGTREPLSHDHHVAAA